MKKKFAITTIIVVLVILAMSVSPTWASATGKKSDMGEAIQTDSVLVDRGGLKGEVDEPYTNFWEGLNYYDEKPVYAVEWTAYQVSMGLVPILFIDNMPAKWIQVQKTNVINNSPNWEIEDPEQATGKIRFKEPGKYNLGIMYWIFPSPSYFMTEYEVDVPSVYFYGAYTCVDDGNVKIRYNFQSLYGLDLEGGFLEVSINGIYHGMHDIQQEYGEYHVEIVVSADEYYDHIAWGAETTFWIFPDEQPMQEVRKYIWYPEMPYPCYNEPEPVK